MSNSIFARINPVLSTEPISLWDCLHDAYLVSSQSDRLRRTLEFRFNILHIKKHFDLPGDLTFLFRFEDVECVRATVWVQWPGDFAVPKGTERAEASRLIAEYHKKWREESLSWDVFEEIVEDDPVDISLAEVKINENAVSLAMSAVCDGDKYEGSCTVYVRASRILVERSDGQECSMEQLLAMGVAFWETQHSL